MRWRNPEAGKRFAELVQADKGLTAADIGELLALEGHTVAVDGTTVAVYPAQPAGEVDGITLTAKHKGNPGDVLP